MWYFALERLASVGGRVIVLLEQWRPGRGSAGLWLLEGLCAEYNINVAEARSRVFFGLV